MSTAGSRSGSAFLSPGQAGRGLIPAQITCPSEQPSLSHHGQAFSYKHGISCLSPLLRFQRNTTIVKAHGYTCTKSQLNTGGSLYGYASFSHQIPLPLL